MCLSPRVGLALLLDRTLSGGYLVRILLSSAPKHPFLAYGFICILACYSFIFWLSDRLDFFMALPGFNAFFRFKTSGSVIISSTIF